MNASLGILETTGLTPALAALDAMEKAARIEVLQAELNDFLGIVIKIRGSVDSVETALGQGRAVADSLHGDPVTTLIRRPAAEAEKALLSAAEFNPLIQQNVVQFPQYQIISDHSQTVHARSTMASASPQALGFIETQGFTAVFDAIDTACKAANVEVIGKEKLGGGYVTVVIQGDVAAVTAALEAGRSRVDALGKLIAAHIVTRPSESVLALLPRS